ncbi:MAG: OmpA family protein, partial [Rhodospirillales bacterium]|nr:OmpA family protein [Rhodospirillales bacterium]
PTVPPVAPPPPPAPMPAPGAPVPVAFAPGSAELSASARAALQALARHPGHALVWVIGYGDAGGPAPAIQAAALALAWQRAEAIAGALRVGGLPDRLLHVTAEAEGHGGLAKPAG